MQVICALGCYNFETGINDEFNSLWTWSFNLNETKVRIDFEENMSTPLETKAKLTQRCKYTRTNWFLSLNEWYNETLSSTYSHIYFASDKYTWRGKIRHEFVDCFTKSIPGINKLMRYPYMDLLFCSVLTLPVLLYSVLFWYGPYLFIK